MSEVERLTSQISATAGSEVLVEVLQGLLALACDEATVMHVERPRDSLNVTLTRVKRHRLPRAA